MDWLGVAGRTYLVTGYANRKSVAWHVGSRLAEAGARVLWSVRTEERRAELLRRVPEAEAFVCDVADDAQLEALATWAGERAPLAGLVHSIAWTNYEAGPKPFHETDRADFLRSVDVSCYSLVALSRGLREAFEPRASVVAISISSTRMAAENYGPMAPVKAALDSTVVFLAKSFSAFSEVRFNAVNAGLLKTSSSAGIPGYVDSLLFAEMATLRKRGLATGEVADTALFLLSERSAGINAQGLVVDAGMGVNYFDASIVRGATRTPGEAGEADGSPDGEAPR